MRRFGIVVGVVVALASSVLADDGSGIRISAAGDIVGQAGVKGTNQTTNRLDVRGAELMIYAPADHIFDGRITIAAHGGGGIASVELHEAFIGSSKLIPRVRFRLGQFFLGVGRLNQFHQHDWPFITAPKVHKEFFAPEGALDTGLEASYLIPVPFFLELTAGITNGHIYGHDHTNGARPLFPTNYARLATYTTMPWEGGAQIGLNYLGRRGGDGTGRTQLGLDFTAKWKEEKVTRFLFQSEFWYRILTPRGSDSLNALGFYLYPQYHLGSGLFAGLRLDYYSNISLKDGLGNQLKNFDLNLVPTLSYQSSEFVTFRLAYNASTEYLVNKFGGLNHMVEAQAVFILGAHPAHDF